MMKLYRYGLPLLVVCVSWFASLVLGQVDSVTQLGPLRSLAVRAGIEFGTAVSASHLDEDSVYRTLLSREFSSITPENEMKWESLGPEPGRYVWENADRIVAFARAHQQRIRGHTLVWHNQMPVWLKPDAFSPDELRKILQRHIQTVVGRYRGSIWQWDVVNEAFNEDGTFRDTLWYRAFGGPEYIAWAFRWAKEADPQALLFYNDYNLEFPSPKADAVLSFLARLKAEGVPIDGIGLQGHISLRYGFPHAQELLDHVRRFVDAGFYVAFTEVDVRMPLPRDNTKDLAQAQVYTQILSTCLALKGKCLSFSIWGFPDKYSWVPGFFPGEGAATPIADDYSPKPAWYQMGLLLYVAAKGR
ncbi:beta-xylanase (plasmid) [Thermus brockianus]|uniref:Beta-xylanase n=2 Tax=Thermus brockianus TaxID=56956 RepID=A0ABN6NLI2_THEBO|nr:beta-xylanase [Thermus brockianus]